MDFGYDSDLGLVGVVTTKGPLGPFFRVGSFTNYLVPVSKKGKRRATFGFADSVTSFDDGR